MPTPHHVFLTATLLATFAFSPSTLAATGTGCADGQREGFLDQAAWPDIAGCSGAWTIPGLSSYAPGQAPACPEITPDDTRSPACRRTAGDDGVNPEGTDCNAADLCETGWHVCMDAMEVAELSASGCGGCVSQEEDAEPLLFLTRQSSTGCGQCANGVGDGPQCTSGSCAAGCFGTEKTSNDVFGCGNYGDVPQSACAPLNRFSQNDCSAIEEQGWSCTSPRGHCEQFNVLHHDPATGGVLCCRGAFEDSDGDGVLD